MAGYTKLNLREIEDQAAEHGLGPDMEARFARDDLGVTQTGLSLQRFGPGFRQPFAHRHGEHEELYVVVAGSGRIRLDDEEVEVSAWDAVRVAPETVRSFVGGPDGLEVLAIGPAGLGDAQVAG